MTDASALPSGQGRMNLFSVPLPRIIELFVGVRLVVFCTKMVRSASHVRGIRATLVEIPIDLLVCIQRNDMVYLQSSHLHRRI